MTLEKNISPFAATFYFNLAHAAIPVPAVAVQARPGQPSPAGLLTVS